ncbi:MAG: cache domain-containing protein, partial [Niameybacter sp.]
MNAQQERIKEIVDRTIHDIDREHEKVLSDNQRWFSRAEKMMDQMIENGDLIKGINIVKDMKSNSKQCLDRSIIIWDRATGNIEYSTDQKVTKDEVYSESSLMAYVDTYQEKLVKPTRKKDKVVVLGITSEEIENRVKEVAKYNISTTKLSEGGYIWVREILDYRGGEGYARSVVNPHASYAEGVLVSTHTKNSDGNFPYIKELQELNARGESLNKYYYKKLGSDEVTLKLSYARLYPRYNWVIATGVHLDDIEDYNVKYNSRTSRELKKQIAVNFAMTLLLFVIAAVTGGILFNYYEIKKRRLLKEKQRLMAYHYELVEHKYDHANKIMHDI